MVPPAASGFQQSKEMVFILRSKNERRSKRWLAETEESVLSDWQKEKTFEESLKNREGAAVFSFYDGPPFANGLPHFGHSLVTSIRCLLADTKQ